MRANCYRCRKPEALCLCARTRSVSNRTRVVILQHRRERDHAVGTARIARLGLGSMSLEEVTGSGSCPPLSDDAALLFPGPAARDLTTLQAHERPRDLVVLDGTWRHAKQMLRDNPWLSGLRQVRLAPTTPSNYRIRLQPAAHCVSTIESIVAALRILEPETAGLDGLLDVFDSMIDDQIVHRDDPAGQARFPVRKPRPSRAVPEVLLQHPERLLVVYGETAPIDPPGPSGSRRQLVTWSAARPATGEVFERVLEPAGRAPVAAHLAHMGLSHDDLLRGCTREELVAAWRDFRGEDDLLCAWNTPLLRMLRWFDPDAVAALSLKALWSNVTHTRCGGLEGLVERLGLEPVPVDVRGRAALRLGCAAAVARHMVKVAPRLAHDRIATGQRVVIPQP